MNQDSIKRLAQDLLKTAGIEINGPHPWDVKVHNEDVYARVLSKKELGLGESYMDGWWDCDRLDLFFDKIFRTKLDEKVKSSFSLVFRIFLFKIVNMQVGKHAYEVGEKHYDLGNVLFQKMLDSRMIYSCAYWKNANTLDEAQLAKLKLICEKLQLQPGMRLLDIGCGWGALAKYAAEQYGVSVVGITISKEQYKYAKEICAGLPIEIRLQDYHDVTEKFDRIVSVGMFEHVGNLNHASYMKVAHRCLIDEGIFLLHTIGANQSTVATNPWLSKYIFPNSVLPSIAQIGRAIENLFVMEDWHNFGVDYDKTLMAWHANFNSAWDQLKHNYNERFRRMWNFYLLSSAASFRSRTIQLWQVVLSKDGLKKGYIAPR